MKKGRKEGRKEERKEGKQEGRKEGITSHQTVSLSHTMDDLLLFNIV